MVFLAWLTSLLLSSPQALMFRKLKHPMLEFYQCTTNMVVETYSEMVLENGQHKLKFFGFDPTFIYKIYNGSFLFFVYFFPLFCLIISYTIIIILIKRYQRVFISLFQFWLDAFVGFYNFIFYSFDYFLNSTLGF